MCRQTDLKIDDARVVPPAAPLPLEKIRRKSPSSRGISAASELEKSAAFRGSKFDKQGYCLSHPTVKLVQPLKDGNGKVCLVFPSRAESQF